MEETTKTVSVPELKRLIFSIAEQKLRLSIRYRNAGQLWYPNFLHIVAVQGEHRILFQDEIRHHLISHPDLSAIIEFELDGWFYPFEPNCHYQVSGNHATENYVQINDHAES